MYFVLNYPCIFSVLWYNFDRAMESEKTIAQVVGQRVKELRIRSGLSQEALAQKAGIAPSTLSEIESARYSPRLTTVALLAESLNIPLASLLRPEPNPIEAHLRAIETPQNVSALQQWAERFHRYAQLEALLITNQITAPAYTGIFPEEVAESERARLQLSHEPIDDLVGIIESAGMRVIGAELPETDIDGALFYIDSARPAYALVNISKPPLRQRFTLAHGYGHFLLHRGITKIDRAVYKGEDIAEKEANLFASAFLIPEEGVRKTLEEFGFKRAKRVSVLLWIILKRRFRVSIPALAWRLYNLKVISNQELKWALEEGSLLRKIEHELMGTMPDPPPIPTLTDRMVSLTLLAWTQEKISDTFTAQILERTLAKILEYLNALPMDIKQAKEYSEFLQTPPQHGGCHSSSENEVVAG